MSNSLKFLFSFFFLVFLFSCGSHQISEEQAMFRWSQKHAIVITGIWGSSGAHSAVTYEKPRYAWNDIWPSGDDLFISSYGDMFFRMEGSLAHNIIKFKMEKPDEPLWQLSTEGDEYDSYPRQMVFLNNEKAYLLRYGSPYVWIVNPSANQVANFKKGRLDLSEYSNCGGVPEISSAVIVKNKLFIAMQRLCHWSASDDAYIAVFNTDETDEEINTGKGQNGLKGIRLDVRNPYADIVYHDGYIYVAGADNLYSTPNQPIKAGVQRVDVNDYSTSPVQESNMQISSMEVISHNKVYLVEYAGWGDNRLRLLDFNNQALHPNNVAGIGDSGDREISSIRKDYDGRIWLSERSISNDGIYIIDTSTDTIEEGPIYTGLSPLDVAFCHR